MAMATKSKESTDATSHGGEWIMFIDNLSKRVSRSALKELSSHYGKVVQVFILVINKKPKYKDSTFAFVFVACREYMDRMVMDKSTIDGKLVKVSQPRFPRPRAEISNSQRSDRNGGFHRHVAWKPLVGNPRLPQMFREQLARMVQLKCHIWMIY
ncbi:hypothetical protein V6N13_064374 [Hibiscus sabdariffa]|uniref:RRM domain-containing protein n=1 Tax=Hibiscus sabdariffa TaxID=183260 RepID=A0ABR2E9W7_9ROSI